MENPSITNLFPIPVLTFQYGDISEDEFKTVQEHLQYLKPSALNYLTHENYILDKGLPEIRNFIQESIDFYAKEILVGDDFTNSELDFRITQSWISVTPPRSLGHHRHVHPNSLISGVFYIKANPDIDKIDFINENLERSTLRVNVKKYNSYNSGIWYLPVRNGQLFLFPSNLPHRVPPVQGSEDRISLAFNVFPYGKLGIRDDLTEVHIC